MSNEKENRLIIPLSEFETVDNSDKAVERQARGFILGSTKIQRNKEVKKKLEEKVVKRIGGKGKYLVDKLFELIEGVYVMEKANNLDGGGRGKTIKYYQVPPNLQAITYALDRVLGKPTVHTEHNEEKTGILIIENIIKDLAGTPADNKDEGIKGKNIIGENGITQNDINERLGKVVI